MPCGTEVKKRLDAVDCDACGAHDIRSIYKCSNCKEWVCVKCIITGTVNFCTRCKADWCGYSG